jgi:predicted deacylase
MHVESLSLLATVPGLSQRLQVLRFGRPGTGPKAMIQAALHADEVPAMLVARCLAEQLTRLEAQGDVVGEVVLVPYANPIGLAQRLLGQHQGRFDLRDGTNFNRAVPDLAPALVQALQGRLGPDGQANVGLARQALREALAAALIAQPPQHAAEDLKQRLLGLALDADIVLDLHCDAEAVLHLYGLTPQAALCEELGALMGAQAILLATESGDSPFDEACSRPWLVAAESLAPQPLPLACFSSTVELRGQADTSHELAAQDAQAIVEFLRRRGVLAGAPMPLPLPQALCEPTPLAASEPVCAPCTGVVVFHVMPGQRVEAGSLIADIVDIDQGQRVPVRAQSAGLLYTRTATRWASRGDRLAKIAGTSLARSGKLLSP